METDKLKDMFERQKKFQELLKNFPITLVTQRKELINNFSLALIVETTEALQETNWKPWQKNGFYDKSKFQNEIVDCWHFLINLSLIAFDNEEDFYRKFIEKNNENIKRQERGY